TALEAEAAFVRNRSGGLPDDEAFVRRGGKDPSAARVLDDMRVVGPGIVGEHGEFEAVLAFSFGVARACVAAGFAQGGQDVAEETDRGWLKEGCRLRIAARARLDSYRDLDALRTE